VIAGFKGLLENRYRCRPRSSGACTASEVTLACVEALFDRVVNSPMLDSEQPSLADVDGAERELVRLIGEEAERNPSADSG
jgi:hypothetical protein